MSSRIVSAAVDYDQHAEPLKVKNKQVQKQDILFLCKTPELIGSHRTCIFQTYILRDDFTGKPCQHQKPATQQI